jgi:hypothetical protein
MRSLNHAGAKGFSERATGAGILYLTIEDPSLAAQDYKLCITKYKISAILCLAKYGYIVAASLLSNELYWAALDPGC